MKMTKFVANSAKVVLDGGILLRIWLIVLLVAIAIGIYAYVGQLTDGLMTTAMRDQVSWGFYIGNFTFLVGLSDAAVLVVIPAYVYNWGPTKEVSVLALLLAISAVIMCLLFVYVDIGRPERFWHLIPLLGILNWPASLLAWDFVVLNLYLLLNIAIVIPFLRNAYNQKPPTTRFLRSLLLLSIPAAIIVHAVTAFLYNGHAARPFWNAAILAPRFIASAFASGPAVLIIAFQLFRSMKTTRFNIPDEAIQKLAELMAYAMFINLFLFGAEIFREFYSDTSHLVYSRYVFFGLEGQTALVPYAWTALICSLVAFAILLLPQLRRNPILLNIGCLLVFAGVYLEKGMNLVVPGFTPDTLGEVYVYSPTWTEIGVGIGIFGIGALLFTVSSRFAIAILDGRLTARGLTEPHDTVEESVAPA